MHAQVIVVAGPSGSGKSRLCSRLQEHPGVPVVNLDDFYKNGDDPTLPRISLAPGQEIVDWDDPASWSHDDALDALERLCHEGAADIPVYDISRDGRVGTTSLAWAGRRTSSRRGCSPRRSCGAAGSAACSPTRCACATTGSSPSGGG